MDAKTFTQDPRAFYENNPAYMARLEAQRANVSWFARYYEEVLRRSKPTDRILDAGCGTGITTCRLHEHRPHIEGIDFSSSFIDEARKFGGDYFRVMDLTRLQYPDATFDVVCSADTIEHVPDLETALAEIKRVLKPSGALIIQAPNLSSNLLSVNYPKTAANILRKTGYLFGDLFQTSLRTIQNSKLEVISGDDDAFNLISPIWLRKYLSRNGFQVHFVTTYNLFFVPKSGFVRATLSVLEHAPLSKHIGGRILLSATKA